MMVRWGSRLIAGQAVKVGRTCWSNPMLMIVAGLLAGAGFGYLMPLSAAGSEDGTWMPLDFDKGMEVFTGTSHAFIPREPGFVSEGNCRLSGRTKFLRLESDDPDIVRLGYVVDLAAPPTTMPDSDAAPSSPGSTLQTVCSPYNVQFSFSFFDADGFRLHDVRTPTQRLSPSESCSFRGIAKQPVPRDVADHTEKVDCRLCFEGIEIP